MMHAHWATALSADRRQSAGGLAMIALLAARGWLSWSAFGHGLVHRPADAPTEECHKFRDLIDHSTQTAKSIFDSMNEEVAGYDPDKVSDPGAYNAWAARIQLDAAQMTGQTVLPQWARALADVSRQIADLVPIAAMDPSPDVDEEHQDWVKRYDELSTVFDSARNEFRLTCPGMQLAEWR